MKIGILGSGDVAKALAGGFLKHGHDVMLGTRTPAKLAEWAAKNPQGRIAGFADAAKFAELVVLAEFREQGGDVVSDLGIAQPDVVGIVPLDQVQEEAFQYMRWWLRLRHHDSALPPNPRPLWRANRLDCVNCGRGCPWAQVTLV